MKTNKAAIAAQVAKQVGVSQDTADAVISAALDAIVAAVADGGQVQFVGFGIFEAHSRAGRMVKNPRTGEPMQIAGSITPAFRAGRLFKDAVRA